MKTGTLTDQEFLELELNMGLSHQNESYKMGFMLAAMELRVFCFKNKLPFTSFLDLGSGIGVYASVVADLGLKVTAFDLSEVHKQYFEKNCENANLINYEVCDFTKTELPAVDVTGFIEVAEHLPDDELIPVIQQLSKKTKILHFSSTPIRTEFDEAWGHVNIKPTEQWDMLFQDCGFEFVSRIHYPVVYSTLYLSKELK